MGEVRERELAKTRDLRSAQKIELPIESKKLLVAMAGKAGTIAAGNRLRWRFVPQDS